MGEVGEVLQRNPGRFTSTVRVPIGTDEKECGAIRGERPGRGRATGGRGQGRSWFTTWYRWRLSWSSSARLPLARLGRRTQRGSTPRPMRPTRLGLGTGRSGSRWTVAQSSPVQPTRTALRGAGEPTPTASWATARRRSERHPSRWSDPGAPGRSTESWTSRPVRHSPVRCSTWGPCGVGAATTRASSAQATPRPRRLRCRSSALVVREPSPMSSTSPQVRSTRARSNPTGTSTAGVRGTSVSSATGPRATAPRRYSR